MIISLSTEATATVRELWTLEVADDAVIDWRSEWSDVLDHPEEYGAEIVEVRNVDVYDEHDRELRAMFNEAGEEIAVEPLTD